jgi:hypothetical protein
MASLEPEEQETLLKDEDWGRIWARAFFEDAVKKEVEFSPRQAAESFLRGQKLSSNPETPLSDDEYVSFYKALNKSPLEKCMAILDNRIDLNDLDILFPLSTLQGSEWILRNKKDPTKKLLSLIQKIDGWDERPDLPLTRREWARVYTAAALDLNFKRALQKDPASAVRKFAEEKEIPRKAEAPLITLPILEELLNHPALPAALRDRTALIRKLEMIAAGSDPEYEAVLEAHLSC